jgi:Arc/MetJ family transcription regulator
MRMSKTMIDLDDGLLAEAAEILGTTTKKDTVNRALAELIRSRRREELINWLVSDPLPDLRDPQIMGQAWR